MKFYENKTSKNIAFRSFRRQITEFFLKKKIFQQESLVLL